MDRLPHVLRHEWRLLRTDRALWLSLAVFTGLMLYAAWNGASMLRFQQRTIEDARAEEARRLEGHRSHLAAIATTGEAVPPFRDPRSPSTMGSSLGPAPWRRPPASRSQEDNGCPVGHTCLDLTIEVLITTPAIQGY